MTTFKVGDKVSGGPLVGVLPFTGVIEAVYQGFVDVTLDKAQGKILNVLTDPGNLTLVSDAVQPVPPEILTIKTDGTTPYVAQPAPVVAALEDKTTQPVAPEPGVQVPDGVSYEKPLEQNTAPEGQVTGADKEVAPVAPSSGA